MKLRGRHFNVFSKSTSMEHITGSGVVGKVCLWVFHILLQTVLLVENNEE